MGRVRGLTTRHVCTWIMAETFRVWTVRVLELYRELRAGGTTGRAVHRGGGASGRWRQFTGEARRGSDRYMATPTRRGREGEQTAPR